MMRAADFPPRDAWSTPIFWEQSRLMSVSSRNRQHCNVLVTDGAKGSLRKAFKFFCTNRSVRHF